MSYCNEAAEHLIRAFGGPEKTRETVGGTKWWQARGLPGVDCQWIAERKDWKEAKRRHKEYERRQSMHAPATDAEPSAEHLYSPEMDQMRCLLFAHGGAAVRNDVFFALMASKVATTLGASIRSGE